MFILQRFIAESMSRKLKSFVPITMSLFRSQHWNWCIWFSRFVVIFPKYFGGIIPFLSGLFCADFSSPARLSVPVITDVLFSLVAFRFFYILFAAQFHLPRREIIFIYPVCRRPKIWGLMFFISSRQLQPTVFSAVSVSYFVLPC